MADKPILCIDFDGVIHRYDSGWQGATVIADDATPGFFEWAEEAAKTFTLAIYSSRSKEPGAISAMQIWLIVQRQKWREAGGVSQGHPVTFDFPTQKPAAFLTIDDRAVCFGGDWSKLAPTDLANFKPWNKR